MSTGVHRIRRLRWRVRTGSTEDAFAVRKRLRDELDEVLLPALARTFDALVPGDEVVYLDRLEVHLKVDSIEELPAALREALRDAVQARLVSVSPGADKRIPERETATRTTPTQNRAEALRVYLETGSLPWRVDAAERADLFAWLRSVTLEEVVAALRVASPGGVASLPRAASERPGVVEPVPLERLLERPSEVPAAWFARAPLVFYFRLFQLFLEGDWAKVAEALVVTRGGTEGTEFVEAITVIARRSSWTRYDRLRVAAVVVGGVPPSPEFSAFTARPSPVPGAGQEEALPDGVPLGSERPAKRVNDIARPLTTATKTSPALPESAFGPAPGTGEGRAVNAQNPGEGGAASTSVEAFGLMVDCAGLVLLQPFLARFFESTGVKRAGVAELAVEVLPRAAALLHLVATGEEEPHEFELGFVKVLLGLRPEEALPIASGLVTPDDRDEAEGMLQAVIQHWGALKSTSVRGLRGSFLVRRGLLRQQEQGWRLQVEPAAFDMLLARLPWAISVVKLPWMRKAVFTEWVTP